MIWRMLKLSVILFSILGAGFLLWFWNTVPEGKFETTWRAGSESPFLGGWGPGEALEITKEDFKIVGDRATFKVKLPAEFKEIKFKVEYKNITAPLLLLAGLYGPSEHDLIPQTLYSELIESNPEIKIESPEKRFSYGSGASRSRIIKGSLRGTHIFWLLPGGKEMEINLKIQDMNRHPETDDVRVRISDDRGILKDVVYFDPDIETSSLPNPPRDIKLNVGQVSGSLKLEFISSDDIFIRELQTNAARLVLEDHIFLGDDVGYGGDADPPLLWVDRGTITARTPHREGVQTIHFAGRPLKLVRTNEPVSLKIKSAQGALVPLRAERNDIEFTTAGFFAFSPDDYFAPTPRKIWWDSDKSEKTLALNYTSVKREADGFSSVAIFKTSSLKKEKDGSYRFFIMLPGVHSVGGEVSINSIKVTASK